MLHDFRDYSVFRSSKLIPRPARRLPLLLVRPGAVRADHSPAGDRI